MIIRTDINGNEYIIDFYFMEQIRFYSDEDQEQIFEELDNMRPLEREMLFRFGSIDDIY